jgi:apolipoprotein D and lipocalin family protein
MNNNHNNNNDTNTNNNTNNNNNDHNGNNNDNNVDNSNNAIWGMQFVWPIKADYRIVYLDDSYQQTIIGRKSRDYVWVMARTPKISDADYSALVDVVAELGYQPDLLRKAPHK